MRVRAVLENRGTRELALKEPARPVKGVTRKTTKQSFRFGLAHDTVVVFHLRDVLDSGLLGHERVSLMADHRIC